jgi:hypothetical protein
VIPALTPFKANRDSGDHFEVSASVLLRISNANSSGFKIDSFDNFTNRRPQADKMFLDYSATICRLARVLLKIRKK